MSRPVPIASKAPFAGTARFQIVRALGAGGMGTVYEALDLRAGARVAVKRLHARAPESLTRLKQEFRTLAELRHPNLVSFLELVADEGELLMTMELVDGVDFVSFVGREHQALAASGETLTGRATSGIVPRERAPSLSPVIDHARLRSALAQLLRGLVALHGAGKVHRDIKPSNVLVTPAGRVVLLDFGIAADLDEPSRTRGAAGTRAFMAPEQAAGEALTPKADAYSVGVLSFLALTGGLPFRGAELERRRANEEAPRVRALAPEAPADLADLTDALLDLDPLRRPDAASALGRLGVPVSVARDVSEPAFVGRVAEVSKLAAAIAGASSAPKVAVVVGDSGVGKSALAREVARRFVAEHSGALCLTSRCYERELIPYKAFDGIVEGLAEWLVEGASSGRPSVSLPLDFGLLARVFPALARLSADAAHDPTTSAESPLEARARAFAALRALLGAVVQSRPVLLVIDDLQWADPDSLSLMGDVLAQPGAPALAVMATLRAGVADAFSALETRIGPIERVALAPLADSDALALVHRVLGDEAGVDLRRAIAREAAGHPLMLLVLAEHVASTGASDLAAATLDDAIVRRVAELEPRARALLETLALAGQPLSPSVGASATGLDPTGYVATTDVLRVARLARIGAASSDGDAGEVEPYHDRVRETVVARMPEARRRDCHRALADAIEASGDDARAAEQLAMHRLGAGEAARAVEAAVRAAELAEASLAFERAAALHRLALEHGPRDVAWLRARRLALAEALANAGHAKEAGLAYVDALPFAADGERLELQRRAADHFVRSGHLDRGLAILSGVLAELGDTLPASALVAVVRMLAPRFLPRVRALRYTPTSEPAIDPAALRRVDVYHAVSASLCLVDTARGGAFQSKSVALALTLGELGRIGRTLTLEACYVGSTGERGIARGRRIMTEVERIARRTGDPYLTACATMVDGFLDYHAGAFGPGEAKLARAASEFAPIHGTYFEMGFCEWFGLVALRNRGGLGRLSEGFERWVERAVRRDDRFNEAAIRLNLNAVWLARDDVDGARRDVERVRWLPPANGYHLQNWYAESARAEIALYAGDGRAGLARFRDVWRKLGRSFILRMRIHRHAATYAFVRLLVLVASERETPESERTAMMREAKRRLAGLDDPDVAFARVWHGLMAGALAHLEGDDARARTSLRAARALADASDLPHLAAAARARLGSLTPNPEGAAEREVACAWLASQGVVRPDRMLAIWAPGFAATEAIRS